MSKIVTFLVAAGLMTMAQAYTKEDRIKDMQTMAKAMEEIQTGFFYNNADLVNEGALKLSDTISRIEPPLSEKEEKDPMTRYMNEKVKVTNKIKKKIDQKARNIIERFAQGDPTQSAQSYTDIVKKCMECHTRLRNW
jgi:hypothetical protein